MTDYGRGSGSEQWHSEDPLYGDQWGEQQHYQQHYHPQQQEQYQQEQYQQEQYQYPQQYQQYQQYQQQNHPQQYQQGEWGDQYATGPQPQYPQEQYNPWDTAAHGTGQVDPYADPYGDGQQRPDVYGQGGYPPPQPYEQQHTDHSQQPQGYEQQEPQPQQAQEPSESAPQPTAEWDPDPELLADDTEHAFFSGGQDDEDETGTSRREGKKRGEKGEGGRKRRSGMACLMVLVVLGGGVTGVGLFGYKYYQSHFGPPPDYSGNGSGDVQVQVPSGATATSMANILKKADVVKSVDAFIAAANANPKSLAIQDGVYILHKEMSAKAAVSMMLDPAAQSALIITEGMRDSQIYSAIDNKLKLPAGTTGGIAKAQAKTLGLPSWADDNSEIKDPLEGFLFPSRYSLGKETKPADLLRQMVSRANAEYAKFDLRAEAKKLGLDSPLQVVTVASLVQAEGKTDSDFRKMARVVYNRLQPANTQTNGKLQFDSTYNYLKNQSEINISLAEIRNFNDPYNTYFYKGLPPGPIGNPGEAALEGAMDPEPGDWYYFVSVDGKTTQFAATLAEHDKLVQEFNAAQQKNGQ
jgi:UPF0755 protein